MIDLIQMLEDLKSLSKSYPKSVRIRKLITHYEDKIDELEKMYEEEFSNDVFV